MVVTSPRRPRVTKGNPNAESNWEGLGTGDVAVS